MNYLFKMVRFFAPATVLAALTLLSGAAFGANKHYTLGFTVQPTATAPATVTAVFTNAGNSSFNALALSVPGSPTTPKYKIEKILSAIRGDSTILLPTASITGGGSGMQITNINLPTGTGQTVTVTMQVSTVGSGCTALDGIWNAVLWTGSSPGSGQTFIRDNVPVPPAADTSLSPPCGTLTVTKKVENKGIGTKGPGDFTLKVGSTVVSSGDANPFPNGTYTVSGRPTRTTPGCRSATIAH